MPGLASTRSSSRRGSPVDGGDGGAHRALLPDPHGQRPGARHGDAGDALGLELVVQAAPGPPARGEPGRLADHVAADPDPVRFRVLVVDAGVPDVRRGHRHDLPGVRRVGQRLLVAGHPGVEDHLAERLAARAEALAAQRRAVLEHQDRGLGTARHRVTFPSSTVAAPRRNVACTRPGSAMPANGLLRLLEACAAGSTASAGAAASYSVRLAGLPGASGWPWPGSPADRGRAVRHAVRDAGPVEQAGVHHRELHHAQRGLQAGHAVRGGRPLGLLGLDRVRRVVGGHAVDGAVGQPPAQRVHVGPGAQRRVDLEHGVVAAGEVVGEQQVVRGHLGGHPPALGLGPADDLHRAGRRYVADVQSRSRCARRAGSRAR